MMSEIANTCAFIENKLQTIHEDTREFFTVSFVLKPKLFPEGNKWCALYGENLQEGLAGFGDTPQLAMLDFDRNYYAQRLGGAA